MKKPVLIAAAAVIFVASLSTTRAQAGDGAIAAESSAASQSERSPGAPSRIRIGPLSMSMMTPRSIGRGSASTDTMRRPIIPATAMIPAMATLPDITTATMTLRGTDERDGAVSRLTRTSV